LTIEPNTHLHYDVLQPHHTSIDMPAFRDLFRKATNFRLCKTGADSCVTAIVMLLLCLPSKSREYHFNARTICLLLFSR
jgi:hypothetical protein